jgi:hypothetical protein
MEMWDKGDEKRYGRENSNNKYNSNYLLGVPSMNTWVSIYKVVETGHYNAGNTPV